nr:MAG TPA: hypothetical protein [Inoviridae sp.]
MQFCYKIKPILGFCRYVLKSARQDKVHRIFVYDSRKPGLRG